MKKFILTLAILIVTALPVFGEDDVINKFENGEEVNFMDLYNAINENSIALYSDSSDVTSPEFYDQLTGAEKDMYDLLNTNIESTLTGTSALKYTYETTISKNIELSTSEGNSQYWSEITTAFENQYGMSIANAVVRADFALLYLDKPQYFWININKLGVGMSGGYDKNSGKAKAYITIAKPYYDENNKDKSYDNYYPDCYTDEQTVRDEYSQMMILANEIVDAVPTNVTDWYKLNYYMNWLRDNCDYNAYLSSNKNSTYAYLPTSAFLHGKDGVNAPVCEGYAEALKILCDLSNIDSMCAEAIYQENSSWTGHKFNLVKLNDKYYYCDPTWFDNYNNFESYRFLLTGSVNMAKYDTSKNHTIAFQCNFNAPEISNTDYLNDFGINGYSLLNIDGNDTINVNDTTKLLRIISGIDSGNGKNVDNKNGININDVIIMQKLMFK